MSRRRSVCSSSIITATAPARSFRRKRRAASARLPQRCVPTAEAAGARPGAGRGAISTGGGKAGARFRNLSNNGTARASFLCSGAASGPLRPRLGRAARRRCLLDGRSIFFVSFSMARGVSHPVSADTSIVRCGAPSGPFEYQINLRPRAPCSPPPDSTNLPSTVPAIRSRFPATDTCAPLLSAVNLLRRACPARWQDRPARVGSRDCRSAALCSRDRKCAVD